MKYRKRKVSMRLRRIFYGVCVLITIMTITLIVKGCNCSVNGETTPETPQQDILNSFRYSEVNITDWELEEVAKIIYLEARGQSFEGQQAVAEVILNRVVNSSFPNTIHEVLHEGEKKGILQFTTIKYLNSAKPTETQYKAINSALYGKGILPTEVVFFSRNGENKNVWGQIGEHIFCYEYKW